MKKNLKKLAKRLAVMMTVLTVLGLLAPAKVSAAPSRINVPKFENAPVIDGKVDAAEWGELAFVVKEGEENIAILDEGGVFPAPFTADIYLGYDNTHLYVAAVAEYDVHKNECLLPTDLWQGDCMQIQISDTIGTDRNELGFTFNSLTNKQQAVAWSSTGNFTMEGGEGADYMVLRDGNKTVYELAIGVDQFTTKITEFAENMTIPFSLSFHMSGGGFLEYMDGIVRNKDINLGALLGLGCEPDENAKGPEVDPNAVSVNENLLDSKDHSGNRTVPGRIEVEDYDELYGTEIRTADCPDGTQNLGWTADRDFIVFKGVDFTSVPEKVVFRTSGTGEPTIQLRIDAVNGTKIAETKLVPSGDWDGYINNTTDLINTEGLEGVHDLYLLINGGMNINWFEFGNGEIAEEPAQAEEPAAEEPAAEEPAQVEEPAAEEPAAEEPAAEEPVVEEPAEVISAEDVTPAAPAEKSVNVALIVVIIVVVAAAAAAVVIILNKKKKNA